MTKASHRRATAHLILLLILSVWAGGGCAREGIADEGGGRHLSLVVSVKNVLPGQEPSTKMTADVTQSAGVFRGIEHLWIIPFKTEVPLEEEESVEVAPGDQRLGGNNVVLGSVGIDKRDLVRNNNSHLFVSAFAPTGMNHVLTYGEAPDA